MEVAGVALGTQPDSPPKMSPIALGSQRHVQFFPMLGFSTYASTIRPPDSFQTKPSVLSGANGAI